MSIEKTWTKLGKLPHLRLVGYFDKVIPDVALTPELALWYAIFGEQERNTKTRLIEAYLAIHLPRGDWEEYKRRCIEWVSYLIQESVRRETEPIKEPIPSLLEGLKPIEKDILRYRFGFDDEPHTLKETEEKFNRTRERIRQIEAKALRKLRHPSRSRLLKHLNPGEWLRAKVFIEAGHEIAAPVLFLFWEADRRELEYLNKEKQSLMDELRDVEGLEGYGVAYSISLLKRQNTMLRNQISYLVPLIEEKYQKPINELGWPVRVVNALVRRFDTYPDIPTLGQVLQLTDKELLATRNFGPQSLKVVRETLKLLSV